MLYTKLEVIHVSCFQDIKPLNVIKLLQMAQGQPFLELNYATECT